MHHSSKSQTLTKSVTVKTAETYLCTSVSPQNLPCYHAVIKKFNTKILTISFPVNNEPKTIISIQVKFTQVNTTFSLFAVHFN